MGGVLINDTWDCGCGIWEKLEPMSILQTNSAFTPVPICSYKFLQVKTNLVKIECVWFACAVQYISLGRLCTTGTPKCSLVHRPLPCTCFQCCNIENMVVAWGQGYHKHAPFMCNADLWCNCIITFLNFCLSNSKRKRTDHTPTWHLLVGSNCQAEIALSHE